MPQIQSVSREWWAVFIDPNPDGGGSLLAQYVMTITIYRSPQGQGGRYGTEPAVEPGVGRGDFLYGEAIIGRGREVSSKFGETWFWTVLILVHKGYQ